ncbi:MAG: hypothetical protein PHV74_00785 [Dehalococcoidia bacterium]|nr:hypothetical protein [Dehalococcoidia bacterium]
MADEVLSQAQIDALISRSASQKGADMSPEIEALLTKGSEAPSEGLFAKRIAGKLAQSEGSSAGVPEKGPAVAAPPAPNTSPDKGASSQHGTASAAKPGPNVAPNAASSSPSGEVAATKAAPRQIEPMGSPRAKGPGNVGSGQVMANSDTEKAIKALQSATDALARRMEKVESIAARVSPLESAVANGAQQPSQRPGQDSAKVRQMEMEIKSLRSEIQKITASMQNIMNVTRQKESQMKTINKGLHNSFGYNIRETFECEHCGSQGHVVGLVKCSRCDEESWWGWWPQE